MGIKEIRLQNFEKLVAEGNTLKAIGEKTGIPKNYLSLMRNGTRTFSEAKARQIEEGMGLPIGWFDRADGGISPDSPLYDVAHQCELAGIGDQATTILYSLLAAHQAQK